jgi:DNA-binding NtrC family response regulator
MPTPQMLILTKDDGLRNLFEQLFMIRGDTIVIVSNLQGAKTTLERWAPATCRLVIIDTTTLGTSEVEQQRRACRLLEAWSIRYPMLPVLFLGTILQKYPILAIRFHLVQFIVKPCHLDDLVAALDTLCPRQDLPYSPLYHQ